LYKLPRAGYLTSRDVLPKQRLQQYDAQHLPHFSAGVLCRVNLSAQQLGRDMVAILLCRASVLQNHAFAISVVSRLSAAQRLHSSIVEQGMHEAEQCGARGCCGAVLLGP
jgi:hypothetical protein